MSTFRQIHEGSMNQRRQAPRESDEDRAVALTPTFGTEHSGEDEPSDPVRAAIIKCVWRSAAILVLATVTLLSVPGYYNDIYGPFKLTSDRVAAATSLDAFGWERYFDADFDSFEDTGWYQYISTQETFTRIEARTAPEKFYLVGSLGGVLVAVESQSPAAGPRRVTGRLHLTPPKLRSMLEQVAGGAAIPSFFLQERDPSYRWVLELGLVATAMIGLLWSLARSVLQLRLAQQMVRPDSAAIDKDIARLFKS